MNYEGHEKFINEKVALNELSKYTKLRTYKVKGEEVSPAVDFALNKIIAIAIQRNKTIVTRKVLKLEKELLAVVRTLELSPLQTNAPKKYRTICKLFDVDPW